LNLLRLIGLNLIRPGGLFQKGKLSQGLGVTAAAHFAAWLQTVAHGRSFRAPEQAATIVVRQLDTADSGRLAQGHAGYG